LITLITYPIPTLLLPIQPGALRRRVWRRWPEQGSPGLQAVQRAHDSALAWASEPDE
jgi:hypothetical protein